MPADARLAIANKYLDIVAPDMRKRIPPAEKLEAGQQLIRETRWYRHGRGVRGELAIAGEYTATGRGVILHLFLSQPAAITHGVTRVGWRGKEIEIIKRRRTGKLPMPTIKFETENED